MQALGIKILKFFGPKDQPIPNTANKGQYIDSLEKMPDEIISIILREASPIGCIQLGRISKRFNFLSEQECIWEFFCHANKPDIQNIENLTWKQMYIDKIDFNKFLGGAQSIQLFPSLECKIINVNTSFGTLKCEDFKKIIKIQAHLSWPLESMHIFHQSNKIPDGIQIKSLNLNGADSLLVMSY